MSFINNGNTCYLAAALQCLFSSNYFVSNAHKHLKKTDPFVNSFLQVFDKWLANEQNIDATEFYEQLRLRYTLFDNRQEHDAHEALQVIIDLLSTRCGRSLKSLYDTQCPKEARRQWFSKTINMMYETFRLQLAHHIRCTDCNHTMVWYQCEYGLFEQSIQKEVLLEGYTCDRCNVIDKCLHTVQIQHAPPCLVLKSTICNHNNLQIGAYKYRLVAVCKHYKIGQEKGHYAAIVKNHHDGTWYIKDDGKVELFKGVGGPRVLCDNGCFFVFEI